MNAYPSIIIDTPVKNISNLMNFSNKKLPRDISFENTYLKFLNKISVENDKKPQTTPKANYCLVKPTPLKNAFLISISKNCAEFLDISAEKIENNEEEKKEFTKIFSGSKIIPSSIPTAHCYVGHQFGFFSGQLGDGRAISIGDLYTSKGDLFEIQLKGSGLTPYSRFADGRAVLRSSIREFLASEHLFSLGIPTTRALSIIGSEETVVRDPIYDGNPIKEKCCVVTRISPTFLRFGSFEIFKSSDNLTGHSGPSYGHEEEMLPKMLDYLIKFHYKEIEGEIGETDDHDKKIERFKKLVVALCERTALLVAYWQCYGFCHGVLNTDNMSAVGVTIDYGPYGFLEFFDNSFICNHSDKNGRYCYSEQPVVCKWNLKKFCEGISYCLPKDIGCAIVDEVYDSKYEEFYNKINFAKLGYLLTEEKDPIRINSVKDTFSHLSDYGIDLTSFFRNLSEINKIILNEISKFDCESEEFFQKITSHFNSDENIENLFVESVEKLANYSLNFSLRSSLNRLKIDAKVLTNLEKYYKIDPEILYSLGIEPELVKMQLNKKNENVKFTQNFQNKGMYEILKAEKSLEYFKRHIKFIFEEFSSLINNQEKYQTLLNFKEDDFEFIKNLCLPKDSYDNIVKKAKIFFYSELKKLIDNYNEEKNLKECLEGFLNIRYKYMNKVNPKFILRNHTAQSIIEKSEKGDNEDIQKLLDILMNPFEENENTDLEKRFAADIEKAFNICVSCSS